MRDEPSLQQSGFSWVPEFVGEGKGFMGRGRRPWVGMLGTVQPSSQRVHLGPLLLCRLEGVPIALWGGKRTSVSRVLCSGIFFNPNSPRVACSLSRGNKSIASPAWVPPHLSGAREAQVRGSFLSCTTAGTGAKAKKRAPSPKDPKAGQVPVKEKSPISHSTKEVGIKSLGIFS